MNHDLMKEVLIYWRNSGFKFYVWNYVLFFRISVVITRQRKKWCSCDISISSDKQWRICILWHYDTLNCSKTTNCNQKLKMTVLKKMQGISPMGLNAHLDDSYPNNCPETPKCHQNHEMITFKDEKGLTQW